MFDTSTFEDVLQLLCLGEPACHLPKSPSSDGGGWPSAPTMEESKCALSCILSVVSLIYQMAPFNTLQRGTSLGIIVSKFYPHCFSYNHLRETLKYGGQFSAFVGGSIRLSLHQGKDFPLDSFHIIL